MEFPSGKKIEIVDAPGKSAPEPKAPGGDKKAGPEVTDEGDSLDMWNKEQAALDAKKPGRKPSASKTALHPFKDHPFGVRDDAEMQALTESVKDKGVDSPALVRPREGGGYEVVAGHRRKRASELAGYIDPGAVQPFITWQFTEHENGERDYYWGHYFADEDAAAEDFDTRVADYREYYGFKEHTPAKTEPGLFKYYSTQRPVDIGTFPKTEGGPVKIGSFDRRSFVEDGSFQAWGYLLYTAPLTERQAQSYELRAAPGNSGRVTPEELEAQVQVVGKWEQAKRIPDPSQTWWHPDFGVFVKKEHVTADQVAERYGKVMAHKARNTQKKPIAEQVAEGAEQAAKENAARPAPDQKKQKPDKER